MMAFQYDEFGRPLNPITGMPMDVGGTQPASSSTQGTANFYDDVEEPGFRATIGDPAPSGSTTTPTSQPVPTGSTSQPQDEVYGLGGVTQAWVDQHYPGYSVHGGLLTDMASGGTRISHTKSSPETHPWMYGNPDDVDVNGRIYGTGATQTDSGYVAGRQATDAEMQANYDSRNYYKTGEGLNPELLDAMTRYMTPEGLGDTYNNQYGTYTQQHAIIDERRRALGLDPWVEIASKFLGTDAQGNTVNYANQDSLWGNRGPGLHGEPLGASILGSNVGQIPTKTTTPGSTTPGTTPGTTPPGSGGGTGTPYTPGSGGSTSQPPRNWSNPGQYVDRSTRPGNYAEMYGNAPNATGSNPAMEALKAAMMNGWGG